MMQSGRRGALAAPDQSKLEKESFRERRCQEKGLKGLLGGRRKNG